MASPPLNVLYVILEDCGPQFACYGEPLVRTPVLDRFAGQGVRFSRAFSTSPVCSASRSALMSGCYQTHVGAHQHRTWPWNRRPLVPPVRNMCDWFREAGYFTCNLQPPASEMESAPVHGSRGSGKVDVNFDYERTSPLAPFDGLDWKECPPDRPFFAHITIGETHKGPGWDVARQRPREELVDPAALDLPPYYPDHPVARDECANYLDAVQLVDGYVGELLARLEADGLAGNTVVVISSDHGECLFRSKQFLYDGGLRIPLLVRLPDGRAAGTVDDRLVSGVDILPTLLGFAGLQVPSEATQGRDLFDPSAPARDCVFAARDRMDISIDRMRAVRTDRFKYIRNDLPAIPYMQHNAYKEREYPTWNLVKQLAAEGKLSPEAALLPAREKPMEELYDLEQDPHEVRNLAGDPAHGATLKELRLRLEEWGAKYDTHSRYENVVDNYRGYWGRFPEDPPCPKPSYGG